MSERANLQPGQLFAGDYRVERLIARGGMGAVYAAEQVSCGKRRALKVLHADLVQDAHCRALFETEARVGARIESDHAVEVIGSGIDPERGLPWIAMEYLDGENLAAMVDRVGPIPPADVVEIVEQVCHAVGAAHDAGIIHRDLKPPNVIVARSRRRGEHFVVKVLDFGIAKVLESDRTSATVREIAGSPQWMAPEQGEQGVQIRPSADVWSLGLIVFKMLTGRPYWRSSNVSREQFRRNALLRETVLTPLEPASVRAAQLGVGGLLPPGFDAWFSRCVVREPELRYQNARAAMQGLREALPGVEAARDTRPPRRETLPSPAPAATEAGGPTAAAWPRDPLTAAPRRAHPIAVALTAFAVTGLGAVAFLERASDPPVTVATTTHPSYRARPPAPSLAAAPSPPPPLVADVRALPVVRAPARAAQPVDAPPWATPMQRAQSCGRVARDALSRDTCIIEALRGHAHTAQALGLLATTYEDAGRAREAARTMRRYVRLFPTGPLAPSFQRRLDGRR